MVIYADILFLINVFITYLSLVMCAAVLKIPLKRVRFLLSSFAGGGFAFIIFWDIPLWIGLFLKISACIIMLLIAFGKLPVRLFISLIFIFLLIQVLIGGVVLLLAHFDKRNFYTNGYIPYINLSPLTVLIALIISYFCVSLVNRVLLKRRTGEAVYKVRVEFAGKEYTLFGFCDTGNHLCEPFSGEPVCIVKEGKIDGLSQAPYRRVIPYSALGAQGVVFAVKVPMRIDKKGMQATKKEVYIAESNSALKDMQYDIILHPNTILETEQA